MSKQDSAPLYEALTDFIKEGNITFHVPGHKHGRGLPHWLKKGNFSFDQTEVPGLDDLHCPTGPIKKAQELAAELFHADCTFLLVNGTTCGLQAAIMSLGGSGDSILIPRHAHRAVAGALVLSGAAPVYLKPRLDREFGVPIGVAPEELTQAINESPCIKALVQVHPTYHGFTADLPALTGICHEHGIPVLADEAHGAHFSFHPMLPITAMDAGADISVQSTHKTLAALTQGSMLHIKGNRVNREDIARNLRLLETSSPSYLIMASLDLARRQMAEEGQELLTGVLEMAYWVRERIAYIEGIKCAGTETVTAKAALEGLSLDPTKILINVAGLGLTGYKAAAVLRETYHIQVELADPLNILLVLTVGTVWDDCRAIIAALENLVLTFPPAAGRRTVKPFTLFYDLPLPPVEMTPRDAWFSPVRKVQVEYARGLVSAETVAPYPPGIPVVCAGERITEEVVELLKYIRGNQIACQGLADPAKQTINVIDN